MRKRGSPEEFLASYAVSHAEESCLWSISAAAMHETAPISGTMKTAPSTMILLILALILIVCSVFADSRVVLPLLLLPVFAMTHWVALQLYLHN
jgi:hypothetical protein